MHPACLKKSLSLHLKWLHKNLALHPKLFNKSRAQKVCTKFFIDTCDVSTKAFLCIILFEQIVALHPKCLNKSLVLHLKCMNKSLASHQNVWTTNIWTKVFIWSMFSLTNFILCAQNVWTQNLLCITKLEQKSCLGPEMLNKSLALHSKRLNTTKFEQKSIFTRNSWTNTWLFAQ